MNYNEFLDNIELSDYMELSNYWNYRNISNYWILSDKLMFLRALIYCCLQVLMRKKFGGKLGGHRMKRYSLERGQLL